MEISKLYIVDIHIIPSGNKVSLSIYILYGGIRKRKTNTGVAEIRERTCRAVYVRDDLIGMHEAQRVSNYSQLQSIITGLVMLSLAVSH